MQFYKRLYLFRYTLKLLAFLFLFSSFLLIEGCSRSIFGGAKKKSAPQRAKTIDVTPLIESDTLAALNLDSLSVAAIDTVASAQQIVSDSILALSPDSLSTILTDSLAQSLKDSLALLSADSLAIGQLDSLAQDSTLLDSLPLLKPNQIDAKIAYTAKDSIVFHGNGTAFLYNSAELNYKDIKLESAFMRMKMDSSILYATGMTDSVGEIYGEPVFGEGETVYNSKEMTYNLKTKKGFVKGAVTQEGEGYIISDRVKKTEDDFICIGGSKYTTCDDHDHPHFYINIKKGKVKPGKHVVSGPVNLVLADVPLPLYLPFAFFPFNKSYSSGFFMPTYSDELNRGLGLVNGGYYLAISDYFDAELRGEVYTKGTWGINSTTNYLKRYKFRGNLSLNYREDVTGEKDLPDYSKAKSFSVRWSHSQDAKANPYRTFSANVDFSTSGYTRNNVNTYNRPEINSQNTKSSSISFSQKFPSIPSLSLSGGVQVSQRTSDSTISLQLPNLSISVSRLYPLKRKNPVGKERWYEKISMSYSGSLSNSITAKENKLLQSSFVNDWKNGMRHSIPVSATFNLFNYINITPSFNYNERWHLRKVKQSYDKTNQRVVRDTINGFSRNYDFNMSVSAQTKLYGFYIPSRALFGDKIDRIRHVLTPSISFGYNPDFSDPSWGNYGTYIKESADGTKIEEMKYSLYDGTLYGGPGGGRSGNISFSLGNNLEMKIRNDKDTTGKEPFKKISLIDNFSISSSYNLMADSMNLSLLSTNLRIKIGKSHSISLAGSFDPYIYQLDANGRPVRVNKLSWGQGRFPIFLGTGTSYSFTINNDTFKKLFARMTGRKPSEDGSKGTDDSNSLGDLSGGPNDDDMRNDFNDDPNSFNKKRKRSEANIGDDNYEKVLLPFSLNVSYSVNYRPSMKAEDFLYDKMRYKMHFIHNLSLSANVKFTDNWDVSGNTSYDFEAKKFTQLNVNVTRNLHCWSMTGSFTPFGPYKSYNFRIGVNASMLSDLKYDKKANSGSSDQINWY